MNIAKNSPRLIVKEGCPFAQRTQIVLAAKGIPAFTEAIDLEAPTPDFLRLSPLRKVPVLVHEGHALVESTVINEYLEERFPEPALMPSEPSQRARMRFLVAFDETRLVPAFYRMMMAPAGELRDRAVEHFNRELACFEELALEDAAPFIFGSAPTLADYSAFTHLRRLAVVAGARDVPSPVEPRPLTRWLRSMEDLPAVQAASLPESIMAHDLAPYLDGSADGTTARDLVNT